MIEQLPNQVYIYWIDGDEPFLNVVTKIEELPPDTQVGIYHIKALKIKKVTHELAEESEFRQ